MKKEDASNSIQKACRILMCFGNVSHPLGLIDLHEMTTYPKSTVHRICAVLIEEGFLVKTSEGMKYMLSPTMYALGNNALHSLDIREVAQSYMLQLVEQLNETSALSIEQNLHRICIHREECQDEVRQVIPVGRPFPLYLGASGQVILSYMKEDARNGYLKQLRKSPPPDMTKSVADLEKEIEAVSQKGYAITFGERVQGTVSVSAPILYGNGQVAALSVGGPSYRMNQLKLDQAITLVTRNAKEISGKMNGM